MKVYVSGNRHGQDIESVRATFSQAERKLTTMGMEVVNPLSLLADMEDLDNRTIMLYLLNELSKCEAIWMLDDWQQDSNSAAEFYFAKSAGMKVMNWKEETLLDSLLSKRYKAAGNTEEMMTKTTAEIAYEFEDMCDVSALEVSNWLFRHGFKTIVMQGVVTWVVYEIET